MPRPPHRSTARRITFGALSLLLSLVVACSPPEQPAPERPGRPAPEAGARVGDRPDASPPTRSAPAVSKEKLRRPLPDAQAPAAEPLQVTPPAPPRSTAAVTEAPSTVRASVRMGTGEVAKLIEARTVDPIDERDVRFSEGSLRSVVRREGAVRINGLGARVEVTIPIVATLGGRLETCNAILGRRRCLSQDASLTHRAELRVVVAPRVTADWHLQVDVEQSALSAKTPTDLRVGPVRLPMPRAFDDGLRAASDLLARQIVTEAVGELRLHEAVTTYWARGQRPWPIGQTALSVRVVPEAMGSSELWSDDAQLGVDLFLQARIEVGHAFTDAPRPLPARTSHGAAADGRVQALVPACVPIADVDRQLAAQLRGSFDAGPQRLHVRHAQLYPSEGDLVLAVSFALGDPLLPAAEGDMYFRGTPAVSDGILTLVDLSTDVETGSFLVDLGLETVASAKLDAQLRRAIALEVRGLAELRASLDDYLQTVGAAPVSVSAVLDTLEPAEVTVDEGSLCVVMKAAGTLELALDQTPQQER